MTTTDFPITAAIRFLRSQKVAFTPHLYTYETHGGTATSARELNVAEHCVIKTLILEADHKKPLVVLMHGDCETSTKQLARLLNVKAIHPCDPAIAEKHSGYQVGGTSPFGTRKAMPVYMERSITDLPKIYINGGKRGFLICIAPGELIRTLSPMLVDVALPHDAHVK